MRGKNRRTYVPAQFYAKSSVQDFLNLSRHQIVIETPRVLYATFTPHRISLFHLTSCVCLFVCVPILEREKTSRVRFFSREGQCTVVCLGFDS
jgi:hypothetical protein